MFTRQLGKSLSAAPNAREDQLTEDPKPAWRATPGSLKLLSGDRIPANYCSGIGRGPQNFRGRHRPRATSSVPFPQASPTAYCTINGVSECDSEPPSSFELPNSILYIPTPFNICVPTGHITNTICSIAHREHDNQANLSHVLRAYLGTYQNTVRISPRISRTWNDVDNRDQQPRHS